MNMGRVKRGKKKGSTKCKTEEKKITDLSLSCQLSWITYFKKRQHETTVHDHLVCYDHFGRRSSSIYVWSFGTNFLILALLKVKKRWFYSELPTSQKAKLFKTKGESRFAAISIFRSLPICHFDRRRLEHNSALTATAGQCCFTVTTSPGCQPFNLTLQITLSQEWHPQFLNPSTFDNRKVKMITGHFDISLTWMVFSLCQFQNGILVSSLGCVFFYSSFLSLGVVVTRLLGWFWIHLHLHQ